MRLITIVLALITLITLLVVHEGGRTMAQPSDAVKRTIPPVDREIPAQIETATFALG